MDLANAPRQSTGGRRGSVALFLLVAAFAVVASRSLPTLRRDSGAHADGLVLDGVFSAERAARDLEWLCDGPHPIGSEASERNALRLVAEFQHLGFNAEVRGTEQRPVALNVLAVRPGLAGSPDVLFVAHHDSTPRGPGAGDDGVGVVALLEVARVLNSARSDFPSIGILLTDGEEVGMLGARSLLSAQSGIPKSTVIVNVEAVGNRGPTVVFQAGPKNAELLDWYSEATARPHASSLAEFIFDVLPNNTDFTEFRRAGYRGLNVAMVGGSSAYHAPFDTPANLDRPSLQRLGDTLLALAQSADELRQKPSDQERLFHSVGEWHLFSVPARWGRTLVVLLAVVGLATVWRTEETRPTALSGIAVIFAPLGAALAGDQVIGLLDWTVGSLTRAIGNESPRGDFTSTVVFSAGLLMAGAAIARVVAGRLRAGASLHYCGAGVTLFSVGALGMLAVHPGAAWVLAVPIVPAALAATLASRRSPLAYWVGVTLCLCPIAWFAGVWADLALLTSIRPQVMGAISGGTLALGLPLIAPAFGRSASRAEGWTIFAGVVGCALLAFSASMRALGA